MLRSDHRRAASCLFVLLFLVGALGAARADFDYLPDTERQGRAFEELVIGDRVVYFHQRMLGDAIIEKDAIVYQFDRASGALLARREHWRTDLPARLPELGVTRDQTRFLTGSEWVSSTLMYIDPESVVYPLDPAPANPCWVIRGLVDGRLAIFVVDAVTGARLGRGVPPPFEGYALSGPTDGNPCGGAWDAWYENAASWFARLGYEVETGLRPPVSDLENRIDSQEVALLYEIAHGGSNRFAPGCAGDGYRWVYADEVADWMEHETPLPLAFLASCGGLCQTGDGTLSHALRAGQTEDTATVGYCGMDQPECATCWSVSLDWQDAFFEYLSDGDDVALAVAQADADFPQCHQAQCMRWAGDGDLELAPSLPRAPDPSPRLFREFTTTLQPGVWQGYGLQRADVVRGFVTELTPLENQEIVIERALVEPEYDGEHWNDVFRAQIRAQDPPTDVRVRVYHTRSFPIARQWLFETDPGVLHGFLLGPSSQSRAWVAEVTPLTEAEVVIDRIFVQPEFDGQQWNDVLRLHTWPNTGSCEMVVRAYDVSELPIHVQFTTTLQPGVQHGFLLGSSAHDRAFVPEITPQTAAEAVLERIVVQPEFNGQQWNDVLRLQTRPTDPALAVHVRVRVMTGEPPTAVASDGVPSAVPGPTLAQNAPNPFNPRTEIRFALPAAASVRLDVITLDGRRVATLVEGPLPAGPHAVIWDGRDEAQRPMPSGVYLYRLAAGRSVESRRMVLVR